MLFLHKLPKEATRDELADFVQTQIHAHPLVRLLHHPRLEEVKILRVKKAGDGGTEYHGLIRVTPRHAAPSVLELIDGASFRGTPLSVRPYAERTQTDRRVAYTDPRLLGFPDRRQADRRRESLEMSIVDRTGPAIGVGVPSGSRDRPRRPPSD